jgi:hypothetical protein
MGQLLHSQKQVAAAANIQRASIQQHRMAAAFTLFMRHICTVLLDSFHVIVMGSLLGQSLQSHNHAEAAADINRGSTQQHRMEAKVAPAHLHFMTV